MASYKVEKELEFLKKLKKTHTGEWITYDAIVMYQKRVSGLSKEDIGERRKIRIEFQKRYGLTELEAINLLNGFHVQIYLRKYERMQNLIPLIVEKDKKINSLDDEDDFG